MKYAWASITKSCTNFGNFLIEKNLQELLKEEGLRTKPSFIFDAFKINNRHVADNINKTNFLIVPGCTTLNLKHYPGIVSIIEEIKVPIWNIGPSFFEKPVINSVKYYNKFYQPVGARDPISANFLKIHGIKSKLIGCPTLFSGKAKSYKRKRGFKVVFSFGLKKIDEQLEILNCLIQKGYKVTVIIQENFQKNYISNLHVAMFKYQPERVIEEIKRANLVITGRLHTALPAIALGTPIYFLKTNNDSRFSLLKYLGIRLWKIDRPKKILKSILDQDKANLNKITFNRLWQLKKNFINHMRKVLNDLTG